MEFRVNQKNGDKLSILGFGCMRFPTKGLGIDEPRSTAMVHSAIERGVNYFDTAYIYHKGSSESFLGRALSGGYRERVKIATKLPPFMVTNLDGGKKIFDTQLKRLKTDYIDYYLLHMLTDMSMLNRLKDLGILEWLEELKANGSIRNIGFSFHGIKSEFESIIKAYPWDFCQIQYNYIDENHQATRSGLELSAKLGIPVIVMEPLRGGRLVTNLPHDVRKLFESYSKNWSPAQWALRWVWNHPEVNVVLSGMSNEEQIEENIRIAGSAFPNSLTQEELKIFEKVKSILMEKTKIPCTACGYCMPCPYGVDIPGCFTVYNNKYLLGSKSIKIQYMQGLGALSAKPAIASQCKECGKCEIHCPQQIPIQKELKTVAKEIEGFFYRPFLAIARRFMRIK